MSSETPDAVEPGPEPLSFADALRDSLICGAAFVDGSLATVALAPEAARLLGLGPGSGPNLPFAQLPIPLQETVREVLATGRSIGRRHLEVHLPARGVATLCLSAVPVGAGQTVTGVALVLNDLAPLRRMESHIEALDRLANLGTLTASLAHEIKNALVAGKTFMDLLLEKNQDAELVEVVRRELDRIDTIVTRMLKFGGPSRPELSEISLHEVLEHSLRLIQHRLETNGITLTRSFRAAPERLLGDDHELQQAFVNLLLNALDALPQHGALTVSTETVTHPADSPAGGSAAWLRVTVQDNGIGIPPENLDRLFEPFFTTKDTGTGLGLPITRRIIQRHHGEITARSQPGKGTAFQIMLPTLDKP